MTPPDISRRRILQTAGATGVLALAGCIGGDGDDGNGNNGSGDDGQSQGGTTNGDTNGSVRVGVVQNLDSTTNTGFGHQGVTGLLSGFAYKNGQAEPISIPNDDNLLEIDGQTLEYTVETEGGADNIDLELLIRHTGGNSREAASLTTELIVDDGVDVIFGTSTSDSLNQVNNLPMEEFEVPFFIGQGSTANVTRDAQSCRNHVFRAGLNGAMLARAGALYIANETDFERVSIVSAETSFGRDVRNNYLRILNSEDNDVSVSLDRQVERGFADWEDLLLEANEESEAILYGFTGETGEFFADALAELVFDLDINAYGQSPSRLTFQDIGRSLLDVVGDPEAITRDVINALPFGETTCRYYWHHYDNQVNNWLVDQHTQTYNLVPDLFVGSAFTTASAIVQAFEQAGETSQDAILTELPGMEVNDTPKGTGEYVFQEFNNQAISPITICEWIPTEDRWSEVWPAVVQPSGPLTIGQREQIPKERAALPPSDESVTCDLS